MPSAEIGYPSAKARIEIGITKGVDPKFAHGSRTAVVVLLTTPAFCPERAAKARWQLYDAYYGTMAKGFA